MSLLAPGLASLARVLGHWFLRLPANLSSIKNYVQASGCLDIEKPIISRCLLPLARARFLSFLGVLVSSYCSSSSGGDYHFSTKHIK